MGLAGWPDPGFRVWADGADFKVEHVPSPLRSLVERAILAEQIGADGGIVLHASSVRVDESAWLFVGASGAGKSTLAANAGHPVIADDTVVVRPVDSGVEVRGTRHGRRGIPGDPSPWPLAGLCFIGQSERVASRRLGAHDALERLFPAIFVLHSAGDPPRPLIHPRAAATLMSMASQFPVHELHVPLGYRFDASDLGA